jgi:hypothetical protein
MPQKTWNIKKLVKGASNFDDLLGSSETQFSRTGYVDFDLENPINRTQRRAAKRIKRLGIYKRKTK